MRAVSLFRPCPRNVGPPVLAASRLSGRLVPLLNTYCAPKCEVILSSALRLYRAGGMFEPLLRHALATRLTEL